MNIFILHSNVKTAAMWHVDRHVIKMSVEYTQQLCTAYYHSIGITSNKAASENWDSVLSRFAGFPRFDESGQTKPYKISHYNHPCTRWAFTSIQNFRWFHSLATELAIEYTARYKKHHAVEPLLNWMSSNWPDLPNIGLTPFAQAMPVCFRQSNAIQAYQNYYCFKDSIMQMTWKIPERQPSWFNAENRAKFLKTFHDFTGGIPIESMANADSMHNAKPNIQLTS